MLQSCYDLKYFQFYYLNKLRTLNKIVDCYQSDYTKECRLIITFEVFTTLAILIKLVILETL